MSFQLSLEKNSWKCQWNLKKDSAYVSEIDILRLRTLKLCLLTSKRLWFSMEQNFKSVNVAHNCDESIIAVSALKSNLWLRLNHKQLRSYMLHLAISKTRPWSFEKKRVVDFVIYISVKLVYGVFLLSINCPPFRQFKIIAIDNIISVISWYIIYAYRFFQLKTNVQN